MARSTVNGEGEILTIKQVAQYLKVTERTIYRLAASEGIPAFKVGGSWRFRRSDLDDWIAGRISGAHTAGSSGGRAAVLATDGLARRGGTK